MIGLPQLVVALVALQRLGELWLSRRNTRRLLAAGGIEVGTGHYPLMVALHAAWLAALWVLVPAEAAIQGWWLALFLALQGGRVWVILTLGPYWTTRVIALPNAPLVRRGPYRFMRHPNYAIVAAEIVVLPLVFGAWQIAVAFGALNLALLGHRISIEETVLAPRRGLGRAQGVSVRR